MGLMSIDRGEQDVYRLLVGVIGISRMKRPGSKRCTCRVRGASCPLTRVNRCFKLVSCCDRYITDETARQQEMDVQGKMGFMSIENPEYWVHWEEREEGVRTKDALINSIMGLNDTQVGPSRL
jgi:hypothetical protein